MKVFVLITAVLETLAGAIMLFAPHLMPDLAGAGASTTALARMYGAGAIGLGFFAFQVWQHMRSPIMQKAFLQTFIVFHIGVAVAAFTGYNAGVMSDPSISTLHLIFGLVTIYFYFKKQQSNA